MFWAGNQEVNIGLCSPTTFYRCGFCGFTTMSRSLHPSSWWTRVSQLLQVFDTRRCINVSFGLFVIFKTLIRTFLSSLSYFLSSALPPLLTFLLPSFSIVYSFIMCQLQLSFPFLSFSGCFLLLISSSSPVFTESLFLFHMRPSLILSLFAICLFLAE